MRRREFIVSCLATSCSYAYGAIGHPRIAYFPLASSFAASSLAQEFTSGLKAGLDGGLPAIVEYYYANGDNDLLPRYAEEIISKPYDAIVAAPASAAVAIKRKGTHTPVLFAVGGDPTRLDLVDTFARPGRNFTRIALLGGELGAKKLSLLREIGPAIEKIGFLANPRNLVLPSTLKDITTAASATGLELRTFNASSPAEIDQAFEQMVTAHIDGLIVNADTCFLVRSRQIIGRAVQRNIASIYPVRHYTEIGGLMSFGTNERQGYAELDRMCAKVLRGALPSELPVLRVDRPELVINLQAAETAGVSVPAALLTQADEVIE